MAAQWHYSKGGERHGPVSSEQLKQLAASGQIQPTDLVWRDGMAEWQKASAVKGLFPSQTSSPAEPPPIPKNEPHHVANPVSPTAVPAAGESEKRGLLGTLSSLGRAAQTAAVVAAKKTERAKITNIDLPKAYAALGRDVHGRGAYREEFADLYHQINDALARLRNLEGDSSKQPNLPATLADKAKAAAVATKQKAEAQAIGLQLSRLMSKLGEAVYQRHGNAAGSPETTGPIANLLSRTSTLDAEVEQQRQASGGRFITRRRVVVAAVLACMAIALLVPAIESAREASQKGKVASGKSETMTGDKPDSGDTAPTRDQMIQFTAFTALAGCIWGDEQPKRPNDDSQQFPELLERTLRKWVDTTPERFHGFFLAAAKTTGAHKNADSRFLLTLNPKQVRKTVEGKDVLILDYGADTRILFIPRIDRNAHSLLGASICGVDYVIDKPFFMDPPPIFGNTQTKPAR